MQNQFLGLMSVQEAAQILDLPTHKKGGDLFLNRCLCQDCCDSPVFLGSDNFVCLSPSCKVKAGNLLDFLALHQNGYFKALQLLKLRKPERVAAITGNMPWDTVANDVVEASIQDRKCIEFLYKRQAAQTRDKAVGHLAAITALRKMGFREDVINRDFILFNKADMEKFSKLFPNVDFPTLKDDEGAVAVPFFGSHIKVNAVLLYYGSSLLKTFKITLGEQRLSFAGLWQAASGSWDKLVLVRSPFQAAGLNSKFIDNHIRALAIPVYTMGDAPLTDAPDLGRSHKIIYAHDPNDSFHLGYDLHEKLECPATDFINVLNIGTSYELKPWPEYVYGKVLDHVLEAGQSLSPDYLKAANLTQTQQARLLNDVATMRSPRLAHWLKQVIGKYPVFEGRKGQFIYAEPHGYSIGKHEQLTLICNFTLDFKANLMFEDTSEVLHNVIIKFNDMEVETNLSQTDLELPRHLENKVRFACMPYLKNAAEEKFPAIFSPSHFRQLREYFAHTITGLPNYHGIYNLGWDVRKSTYTSRHWRYVKGSIADKDFHLSPSSELLKMYQAPKVEPMAIPATTKPYYPASVCNLFSITAALISRAYVGMDTIPVAVKNSPAARTVLEAMFKGFGQSDPLELGRTCDRMKAQLVSFRGYPVYGTSELVGELRSVGNPAICLSEFGMHIEDCQAGDLSGHAAWFLQKLIEWLVTTEGKSIQHIPSVSWQMSLIMEGTKIMREALNLPWPESELPYMALEKALQRIPLDQTAKFFTYDIDTQTVDFNFSELGVNPTDLELELMRLTKKRSVNNGCATMDAVSAMQLLRSFYQSEPHTTIRKRSQLNQDSEVVPLYVRGSE